MVKETSISQELHLALEEDKQATIFKIEATQELLIASEVAHRTRSYLVSLITDTNSPGVKEYFRRYLETERKQHD